MGVRRVRAVAAAFAGACIVLAAGCGTPPYMGATFMERAQDAPPSQPPPGKALVVFHRPAWFVASGLSFTIWNEHEFIGLTKGKQGVWYIAEPGEHLFIGRCEQAGDWGAVYFGEEVSAVQATLAPDEVYDIYCEAHLHLLSHLVTLRPVRESDDRLREKVPRWIRRQRWLVMNPPSEEKQRLFEAQERELMDAAIAEVQSEAAAGTLPRLLPEDAR